MTNEQKLELKLIESYKYEEHLENELRVLRRTKFLSFAEEECWVFQEDGENYLDNLCCPVVISPNRLIEIRETLQEVFDIGCGDLKSIQKLLKMLS